MNAILENISTAGVRLLEPLTLEQTYQRIISESARLLNANYGALFLHEDHALVRKAIYPSNSKILFTPRRDGFTYNSFLKRKINIVHGKQIWKIHPEFRNENYGSSICLPLSDHKRSIGSIMLLTHESRKFTNKESSMLKIFGSYASLAIDKATLLHELTSALKNRDLFISMASHELRTPITTIHGYAQLLQSKFAKKDDVEAKWINELTWETQRLTILVSELLEVNRIKNGQLDYAWKVADIRLIISRAMNNSKFNHRDRYITYQDDAQGKSVEVVCDFDKLLQVLTNLLDNAAKFSPAHSEIILTLKASPRFVLITVKDHGKGIDIEDMPNIFNEYYKKAKHGEEGMGLGLYLGKNIIKMHHGTISVKSKKNKGTTVTIKLPRAKN